ncbi:hypothetical protein AN958_11729 [Leucoagaricus sp. SymC.cos]|nr:hypothetical protein AN958_11729 [Leucoagaricus sp. SymC.cos]
MSSQASINFKPFLAILCAAATLCSTGLSIFLYVKTSAIIDFTEIRTSPIPATFRRPNPYINLDRITHVSDFPPITNFPEVVLQMLLNDSRRPMKEDHRMQRTKVGTIYPDDRHIVVTREISTVLQFRHYDYAMEKCTLKAVIPDYAENKPFNDNIVDIWLLDTSDEISAQLPNTWTHAPERRNLLTSLTISPTSDPSYEFDCRSNEFTTFELACPSSPNLRCHVDFWQDRRKLPTGGELYSNPQYLDYLIITHRCIHYSKAWSGLKGAGVMLRLIHISNIRFNTVSRFGEE